MDNFGIFGHGMTIYDDMLDNENYRFNIVNSDKTIDVSGVMQNELSIGGDNQFGSARDLIRETISAIPKIGDTILKARDAMDLPMKAAGMSTISDFSSRLVWSESAKPQFAIEYKMYNTSYKEAESTKGALNMALSLQKGTLPTRSSKKFKVGMYIKQFAGLEGTYFSAPLGYKSYDPRFKGPTGLLNLSIGKWFRATKLVMQNTNFTPSIQVMKNGQPLFVTGSVTLEPYQMISYSEFRSYFRM